MSLIPGRRISTPEDPRQVEEQLIQRYALAPEDVARVRALQQRSELRFAEAAMRLGLITPTDLDQFSQLPPPAVAEPSARPASALVIAHDSFHPHSERIRALRTELLLRMDDSNGALAIISAMPQEGRSRLAAELAIALSQLGRRTLLVDADLRNPAQDLQFSAPREPGLAEALQTGAQPNIQLLAGLPNLFLMTAGSAGAKPLELLSDGRFARLLNNWRQQFRHVVVDTPPVSRSSDALAIAAEARQVLLAVRAGVTPVSQLGALQRRLRATEATVLGAAYGQFG